MTADLAQRWEDRVMRAAHPVAWPALRLSRAPVQRIPRLGVLVRDPALLRATLMDTAHFSKTGPGAPSDLWTPVLGPAVLLNMEGADHLALRRSLGPLFAPSYVDPLVEASLPTATLTARLAAGDPVDLVAEAKRNASIMISQLVGIHEAQIDDELFQRVSSITRFVRLSRPRLSDAQVTAARGILAELTAHARVAYAGDESTVPGRMRALGLSEDEAMGAVGAFVLTGTETLVSYIPRLIALLIDSGWMPRLAHDADLIEPALAEGLRVTTPSPVMLRSVIAATEIGGVPVRPGDRVILATFLANGSRGGFDPVGNPAASLKQLWFGAGTHFCLGAPLAMAQTRATLGAVLAAGPVRIVSRRAARGVLIPSYASLVVQCEPDDRRPRRPSALASRRGPEMALAPSSSAPDLLESLLAACQRTPDAPALTLRRTTLRYRDLADRIHRVSSFLRAAGMQPGDRVLFSVRPGLDGICLALGVIHAGGTVVFADPGAGEALFRSRAALAAPAWVAAESLLYAASSGPLRGIARRRGLALPDYASVVPDARHVYAGRWLPGVPKGALSLRRWLSRARSGRIETGNEVSRDRRPGRPSALASRQGPEMALAPSSSALIIFTSGTTDDPKAVVHTRASLGTGLDDFAAAIAFVPGERVVTDQLMIGIPALIGGAHWMLPPPGADPGARPEKYLRLLPEADVLFAVPAALDAILTLLERRPELTPRLRAVLLGGAPVLRPLLERVRAQLPGARIHAIYGMTEILPVAIADGDEKLAFTGPGDLVGTVMPHIRARIDDGELVLAGEGLAPHYLGKPPLGELRTGDLARLDGDRLVLEGRAKDMFIRGTTNVYPGLYEPVIAGLPGIAEVALVGIPDEIGDDALVLVVVPGPGYDEAALRRALPGLIDSAVLPDRIMAVDALPTAGRSHKLDRTALARLIEARLIEERRRS